MNGQTQGLTGEMLANVSVSEALRDWRKDLKRMKLDYLKREGSGFFEASGGYTMEVKSYNDRTANALTRCIVDYVKFSGGYSNRISTTGIMRKIHGQMKWTQGNSNKGAADIRILMNGISGDVEVKIGPDKVSAAQERERMRIQRAGGLYFVAADMPSFIQWFKANFFINN